MFDIQHKVQKNFVVNSDMVDDISEDVNLMVSFELDIDGTFESMNYKLKSDNIKHNFYTLNKLHTILPHIIDTSNYQYPSNFNDGPKMVILRNDLDHEYILNKEKIMEFLADDDYDWYQEFDSPEEWFDFFNKFHQNEYFYEDHTTAHKTIRKLFRARCEYEYFDHVLPSGHTHETPPKFTIDEDMFDFLRQNKHVIIDQSQESIQYFKNLMYECHDKECVDNLFKVIEKVRMAFGNVMLYKTSQRDMEESGYLWILGKHGKYN